MNYEFTDEEIMLLAILVERGVDALFNAPNFEKNIEQYWFSEDDALNLNAKLSDLDNEARGRFARI